MAGVFNVAANGIIMREDGKILILKRSPKYDYDPGKWDTVSGRLEQNIKSVKDELYREIREELGENFKCEIISPISTYNFFRGKDKKSELIGIDFVCFYQEGRIVLSEEHTEYKWIAPDDFLTHDISESLKDAVKIVLKAKDFFYQNKDFFRNY